MSEFRRFIEGPLDDIDVWRAKLRTRGPVVNIQQREDKGTLLLYHGFNQDPATFNYTFDPSKSEQGLLWFTHIMIRGYNPLEYARSRGDYVLKYDLPIVKRYEIATYQDGSEEKRPSKEDIRLVTPTENSQFMAHFDEVIELPRGWFFTYKHEKFIGTNQIIHARPKQIEKS